MIDFNLDNSNDFQFFNNYNENSLMPQEPNQFYGFVNFDKIFEPKYPSLLNDSDDDDQHSVLFNKEKVPSENPYQYKDENDKVDYAYHEIDMIPEAKNEEYMQINEEAIPKIFDITKVEKANKKSIPSYPRIDDYKIYWRAKINKFYIEWLNRLIDESELPSELKKIIHAPNYKKFTIIVKRSSINEDLSKTMRTILTIGHETQKNQRQNLQNIQAIFNYNSNHPNQSVQEIVDLLLKTYEQIIEEFYDSQKFNE